MQNFLGKDNFIWWVGEVVDRMDPLGLGRCKVRIFGWHTDGSEVSKLEIKIEDLPWAMPLLPLNNRNSFSSPLVGDWVVGFFFDGEAGQFPVMMGVLPAFNPNTEN